MTEQPRLVLDASALLAYLQDEPGADRVEEALSGPVAVSAVNWAEILSKLADHGRDPDREADRILRNILHGSGLIVAPLEESGAREIAALRTATKLLGLGLGDRACLALARRLRLPVLTADRSWTTLKLGIRVQSVR